MEPDKVMNRIRVLRSKNAGPYTITFDIVLRDDSDFDNVRSNLSGDDVARAYAIPVTDVLGTDALPALHALKISIRRRTPSGHPGDSDCYGMNQEEPLARVVMGLLS